MEMPPLILLSPGSRSLLRERDHRNRCPGSKPERASVDVAAAVVQIAGTRCGARVRQAFKPKLTSESGSSLRRSSALQVTLIPTSWSMGAGNHPWYERLLLGSQSTRVLHDAPCSVIIAHDPPSLDHGPILFGTDGSTDSTLALRAMCDLLDPATCKVTVLGVAPVPYPTFAGGAGIASASAAFSEEAQAEFTAGAREHAEEAGAILEKGRFSGRTQVEARISGARIAGRGRVDAR